MKALKYALTLMLLSFISAHAVDRKPQQNAPARFTHEGANGQTYVFYCMSEEALAPVMSILNGAPAISELTTDAYGLAISFPRGPSSRDAPAIRISSAIPCTVRVDLAASKR